MAKSICKIFLALSIAVASVHAQESWDLVWSDEFGGSALDMSNWSFQIGTGTIYGIPAGWGNNELQYYTSHPQNLSVSNGTLKVIAREESFGGQNYTSARIRTLNKADFLYGRIEARMKIPSTQGIWPAFWMLPTNSPYGIWAASGEIDVMESVNAADRIFGTIHYGSTAPNNQMTGVQFADGTDFSQAFHVFRIDWDPDTITWSIDGVTFGSVNSAQWFSSADPSNPRAPFDNDFHMLLNVAVGGNFPGAPDAGSVFPQTLEVDYVRVYKRAQNPFTGSPQPIPGTIEAEDFDLGIQGQSYSDCDPTNNGGAYRDTGVDIQASTEGGFNIGWICSGEWVEYTVDVQTTGTYDLEARVASQFAGAGFRIERDGVDLTGDINIPQTGGFQSWQSVHATLDLQAGVQVLRWANSAQGYNFNSMNFTLQAPTACSRADFAQPFGALNFFDVSAFLVALSTQNPTADMNNDASFDFFDVSAFLILFNAGCP